MDNNRGGGGHRKVDVKPPSIFSAPTPINDFISTENEQWTNAGCVTCNASHTSSLFCAHITKEGPLFGVTICDPKDIASKATERSWLQDQLQAPQSSLSTPLQCQNQEDWSLKRLE